MATSVSASSSTNSKVDTDLLKALGVGAGIDIKQLAETLTEAQRAPRKERIDASIATSEAKVSGYSTMLFGLGQLDTAFKSLNDKKDFQSLNTTSSNSAAITGTADTSASEGQHTIDINRLARGLRLTGAGFSSKTATINSGTAFNVAITKGGTTTTIQLGNTAQITESGTFASSGTSINGGNAFQITIGGTTINVDGSTYATTPAGVVSAINASSSGVTAAFESSKIKLTGTAGTAFTALVKWDHDSDGSTAMQAVSDLAFSTNTQTASTGIAATTPSGVVSAINNYTSTTGVTASIIDTGASSNKYKVVLTGKTGASNTYSVALSNKIGGGSVSGLDFSTSLQTAADASLTVDGLAILRSTNTITDVVTGVTMNLFATTSSTATLDIKRDAAGTKAKITNLVNAFNSVSKSFKVLEDSKSEEELGGSLVADSTLRTVKAQVLSMFTGTSNTPGTNITRLSDMGIAINRYSELEINTTKLDAALKDDFEDVRKMFTADTDYQSAYSTSNAGLAGEAVKKLKDLTANNGVIKTKSAGQTRQIASYKEDLKDLEKRLEKIHDRYINQFAVMDTMVDQMNSVRDSLKQQFEYKSNSR